MHNVTSTTAIADAQNADQYSVADIVFAKVRCVHAMRASKTRRLNMSAPPPVSRKKAMILRDACARTITGKVDNAKTMWDQTRHIAWIASLRHDLGVAVVTVPVVELHVATTHKILCACVFAAAKTDVELAAPTLHCWNSMAGETSTVSGMLENHVIAGFVRNCDRNMIPGPLLHGGHRGTLRPHLDGPQVPLLLLLLAVLHTGRHRRRPSYQFQQVHLAPQHRPVHLNQMITQPTLQRPLIAVAAISIGTVVVANDS